MDTTSKAQDDDVNKDTLRSLIQKRGMYTNPNDSQLNYSSSQKKKKLLTEER